MKVLITGGLGTISRYITEALDKQGHEVILLNHNAKDTSRFRNVSVHLADRKNYREFEDACKSLGPFDCVYDMICFTREDAESAVRAFAGNTRQLVFCSTVDVYTKLAPHYPVPDTGERCPSPDFPYAYQKKLAEDILTRAHQQGAFQLTILRPGHTYAEYSPKSHLVFGVFQAPAGASYHLDRIRKGKPIILQGDGLSVWNATHGSDTAKAFVGALGNGKAFGKAYTVAGDETMSYTVIWDTVAHLMGAPPIDYVHIPMQLLRRLLPEQARLCDNNFKYNNIFDNSAAKLDLGFNQEVAFPEGAKRCLDAFGDNYEDSDKPEYAFYDGIVQAYRAMCDRLVCDLGPRG